MSNQENQPAKYNIEINESQGLVVGDKLHVEQHFHARRVQKLHPAENMNMSSENGAKKMANRPFLEPRVDMKTVN